MDDNGAVRDEADSDSDSDIDAGRRRWQQRYDAARKRDADFTTLSGVEVAPVVVEDVVQKRESRVGEGRVGWAHAASARRPGR